MAVKDWSNLSRVVYKRTYARSVGDRVENWSETTDRAIAGNVRGHNVSENEVKRLRHYLTNRKGGPAGRGWWFSGTDGHQRLGGVALCNCWFLTADEWMNWVIAQDLLMLGGGVGMSVEHQFVSKLPKVKKGVIITHRATKDADFIVPDSREGWCELTRRVLESFFVTGRSFTYSTICVRNQGERIVGFGGTASGAIPLVEFISKLCGVLLAREGKHIRPIDAGDIMCSIGEMVVAGNVRRSAIILLGDSWDKEYLKAKRWDLGPIPSQRDRANWSVVCDDVEDLHPLFWKTYEHGEPFGLVNRKNIQKYGRMGELKKDTAIGVNPCAEATLEDGEPCNLWETALSNLDSAEEFEEISRLGLRWTKRVTMERYHHEKCDDVIKRNRRVGIGITGCMETPSLFNPEVLDRAYSAIQNEDEQYSKELGVPRSIRTTVIKPSGTISKVFDVKGEGLHGGYSRYMIQRVRFAADDALVPKLRAAGHYIEPALRIDGSVDSRTLVVDFYEKLPDVLPTTDEGWDTWKQLDTLKLAQKHWSDQSVSVTVYYKRDEIPQIKAWLTDNLKYIKTISFLCHSEHGFKQAPKEAITREQYEKLSAKIKPIDIENVAEGGDLDGAECAGGACPVR